jgi:hypothetical protein
VWLEGGSPELMGNQWWKQGSVVKAVGGWVEELRGATPELRDGSARPGSGRREPTPVRCLMVGRAVAKSWVAWK